jgi:hypothetical protein
MHWQRSGELIMMVLLGGTGTLYGPILGSLVFLVLEEMLSRLTEHWKVILGPLLVLVVLFARGGIAGGIDDWRRRKLTLAQAWAELELMAARGIGAAAGHGREWASRVRCALGEVAARWKPYKMAIGRLLVGLLLSAVAAVNRWRRR